MGAPHRALGLQPEGPPGCGERQEGNCPSPVSGVGGRVLRPPLPRAREPQDCTAGVSPGLPHPTALAPFHPFPAKSPGLRGAFGVEGGLGAGPLPTQGRPMRGTHGTASAQCRALQTAGLGCLLLCHLKDLPNPFPQLRNPRLYGGEGAHAHRAEHRPCQEASASVGRSGCQEVTQSPRRASGPRGGGTAQPAAALTSAFSLHPLPKGKAPLCFTEEES